MAAVRCAGARDAIPGYVGSRVITAPLAIFPRRFRQSMSSDSNTPVHRRRKFSSRIASGGMITITSPSGRIISPSSRIRVQSAPPLANDWETASPLRVVDQLNGPDQPALPHAPHPRTHTSRLVERLQRGSASGERMCSSSAVFLEQIQRGFRHGAGQRMPGECMPVEKCLPFSRIGVKSVEYLRRGHCHAQTACSPPSALSTDRANPASRLRVRMRTFGPCGQTRSSLRRAINSMPKRSASARSSRQKSRPAARSSRPRLARAAR